MTDPAPLTDEELAAMERWAATHAYGNSQAARRYPHDVPRLIAALRACRAEVERLTRQNDELLRLVGSLTSAVPLPGDA